MFYLPQEIPAIRQAAEDALRPAFDHSDVAYVSDWVQRCIDDKAQLWRLNSYWVISEVQDTKTAWRCILCSLLACMSRPWLTRSTHGQNPRLRTLLLLRAPWMPAQTPGLPTQIHHHGKDI